MPYIVSMMMEQTLLAIADTYASVARGREKSLSRVATIVVNRGSFFTSLKKGQTCSVRNYERVLRYFEQRKHWPDAMIPAEAEQYLRQLGRLIPPRDFNLPPTGSAAAHD